VNAPAQAGPAPLPGDPATIRHTAWTMTIYGDLLHDAGAGLARIDTTEGWSGPAADAFRTAYQGQPTAWLRAGDCFHDAAAALNRYADTLVWAQAQVVTARREWDAAVATSNAAVDAYNRATTVSPAGSVGVFTDPGAEGRAAATDMAERAKAQLAAAAADAATVVEHARDQAPPEPTLLDKASAIASVAGGLMVDMLGATVRAVATDPAAVVGMAVGGGLLAVSAALDRIHILDGDPNNPESGGHAPGTGQPHKREFPDTELWTDDHIAGAIEDVARNPDRRPVLDPDSGNYKFHGFHDGVEIGGYVTPDGQVLTGFPISGDGVTINDADGNPHPMTQ
jgi:Bacterial EndoU nuclease